MNMTDKEKIIAEIERLRKNLPWGGSAAQLSMECNCKNEAYTEIEKYINSLPEEPVSKGLEEKINELNKRYPEVSFAKLTRIAVSVDRWEKELSINRACEWLNENLVDVDCVKKDKIERFRKAMEEKQHDTP